MPSRKSSLKPNIYAIVRRAVDEGVAYGLTRAHKHGDRPSREALHEHIGREVINALCEVIDFGDE